MLIALLVQGLSSKCGTITVADGNSTGSTGDSKNSALKISLNETLMGRAIYSEWTSV